MDSGNPRRLYFREALSGRVGEAILQRRTGRFLAAQLWLRCAKG